MPINHFISINNLASRMIPNAYWPACRHRFRSVFGLLCLYQNTDQSQNMLGFKTKSWHRGPEQEGGLTNYSKRADTVRVAGATPLTTPHVWTNHRIRVFWENQFFWFWGVPFDPSYSFGATDGKIELFGIISPGNLQNCGSDQKVLEVWPPKSGVSKAKQGFGGSK